MLGTPATTIHGVAAKLRAAQGIDFDEDFRDTVLSVNSDIERLAK